MPTMQVITLSATYGAGGAAIGPALARRMDLPFVDRAIPAAVAVEIDCSLDEVLAHDGRTETGIGRIFAGAARLPSVTLGGMDLYTPDATGRLLDEADFVEQTERVLRETADRRGGVILGRAGACVLADFPGALHVRLDGPAERRLTRARMESDEPDIRALERRLAETDRARAAYVKHFYRADASDARLYHLVLDSTVLPDATVVEMIALAAEGRAGHP
ncbi:MAG TPA: cytidylate kinase-like family protein [Streptosporangiaceae bacterium]